ncbi:Beta-lactamase transpeptidase protein [Rutstroemia sp. NJR-2017a BVV2]|nr:Beta-lactamase transpeptidase protein [Rutstroemia sp. NJR-2017a BVV2]
MGAAASMHSCTADLVKLYTAFLDSAANQYANSSTSMSGSPLKQVPTLFYPHINMNPKLLREQSYALGWACLQTPGPMDQLRPQKNRPDVGKGVPSELVLYHQVSFPGALAFVALVPRSKGCVLVLTNGLSMSVNAADLMGQGLLEEYLEVAEGDKNDYAELTRTEKEEKDGSWFEDIRRWLDENRTGGDRPRELEDYVGDYWDEAKTLMVKVFIHENESQSNDSEQGRKLKMAFAGMESEEHDLTHYQNDEFTWLKERDEFSKRGLWARHKENYVIGFWEEDGSEEEAGGKDIKVREKSRVHKIEYLSWRYNKELPRPKRFYKEM